MTPPVILRGPAGRLRALLDRRTPRGRRGGVAIIFALVLPAMIGFLGLVIDVGMAYAEKNMLQSSAEAAALASAQHIGGTNHGVALATARDYAGKNRPRIANLVAASEVEFGHWDGRVFTSGGAANAIRVTASRTRAKGNSVRTYFAGLFGLSAWDLSASAVAMVDPVCILLLHPTHGDAFDVDPGAQIDAPGCGVHINSDDHGALELGSNSYVNLQSLRVVGGVDKSSSAIVRPTPMTGAARMADPLAGLAPPVNNACGGAKIIRNTTTTINATFAFCNGLVIENANVTFAPGIYVIKGEFTLKSGAAITGNDVLIYMEGKGHDLFFYSKTSFDLKAPRTGPYAGIVLWSDRANTNDHDIYSKFGASAEGTIYTPSSQIEFENNVEWEADCIRIIASRLELDNNSKYKAANPLTACSNGVNGGVARLVR